ncbi:MAG TPA: M36 family metallopeptidase, partial [Rubricoccaceae bacterium]
MSRLLAVVLGLSLVAPALAQQRPLDVPPAAVDAALGYLRGQAPVRGVASEDVAGLVVADGHTSTRSGVTYLYVRQQLDGLDVVGAQVTVAVGRDGRVVYTAGDLSSGLAAAAAPTAGGNRAAALNAEGALRAAAGHAGIFLGAVVEETAEGGPAQTTQFQADGLSSPARARQVYARTGDGALRRAWEVILDDARSLHWWVLTVDASTGAELGRYDLTVSETFGRAPASFAPLTASGRSPLFDADAFSGYAVAGYKVFPMPFASPLYVAAPPPADGRTTVSGVEDALASPYGWHDTNGAAGAEFTTTRGNNTHTYVDRNDDEAPDAAYPAPDGGAALSFVFPVDFTQAPSTYTAAAAANLFYWSNIVHDVTYRYGFTEAAGNFQANTYGRGGAGNDAVDSEVQSGADICNEANPCVDNANFATPPDGGRPRMQMYIGANPTPDVDGSFDAHVVVHEYGHGVSTRLVGGGASGCLNNVEQMGEGWSDWYGNMLTMRTGDTRTTRRPVGNYLFGQTAAGGGIRPAPYTTDFAVNGYTYQSTRTLGVPHDVGFVWATTLWEVTWDLIDAHGFNADLYNAAGTAGNQIALNLVTEALKMTPCNPGFVSGRNAVLAADAALYPDAANPGRGLHYTRLWAAFARRGLGASASQGSTASNADNTQAFDLPLPAPVASVTPASVAAMVAPNGTTTAAVTVSNTAAAGSAALTFTASIDNATRPRSSAGTRSTVPAEAPGQPLAEAAPMVVTPWVDGRQAAPPLPAASLVAAGAPASEAPAADNSVAVVDCASGQMLNQEMATNALTVTNTQEAGQSFTAPCSGSLSTIAPFLNFNGSPGTAWAATMRVYNGAGATGTLLSSSSFTASNGASGGGYLNVPLATPPRVTQGQVYTWFMDMTSGTTAVQLATPSVYAGGTMYITTNGNPVNAAAYPEYDAQARLTFAAPVVNWVRLSTTGGSVAPGASQTITVTFDATGLGEGTYTADLLVSTNDPATPTRTVPLTL